MRCLDYFGICDFLNWFWGKRGINVGQDYFRSTTASKSFQEDSIKNPLKPRMNVILFFGQLITIVSQVDILLATPK